MIIADTGFWLALANRRDRYHDTARRALEALDEPLITTAPVLTETCHLLVSRLGHSTCIAFMDAIAGGASVVAPMQDGDLGRAAELMRKYADLPMDFADASLVILAERQGDGRILSTDQRDFGVYRWKDTEPFTNLLGC